jgi:hypothetical protein
LSKDLNKAIAFIAAVTNFEARRYKLKKSYICVYRVLSVVIIQIISLVKEWQSLKSEFI